MKILAMNIMTTLNPATDMLNKLLFCPRNTSREFKTMYTYTQPKDIGSSLGKIHTLLLSQ